MLNSNTTSSSEVKDNIIYKLVYRIFRHHTKENVVVSPKSIEMCIGLVLFAAMGDTYQEIYDFLKLETPDDFKIACYFHDFFANCRVGSLIKSSLNIFPSIQYEIKPQIREILKIAFRALPEYVDYERCDEASDHINCWAKQKTCNRITEVVKSSAFKKETSLVLVSIVFVEASWRIPFNPKKTYDGRFFITDDKSIPVDMMRVCDEFYVADLPQLDASAVELGLNYSDISMVFILPNSRTGLKQMIRTIMGMDIFALFDELKLENIQLCIPKFETQFGLDLTQDLKYLDLKSMFSNSANFDALLKFPKHVKVSNIFHKVFIKINEYGIDMDPPTNEHKKARKKKCNPDKNFIIDRPFMYIIKDSKTLYFIGYVIQATRRTHC